MNLPTQSLAAVNANQAAALLAKRAAAIQLVKTAGLFKSAFNWDVAMQAHPQLFGGLIGAGVGGAGGYLLGRQHREEDPDAPSALTTGLTGALAGGAVGLGAGALHKGLGNIGDVTKAEKAYTQLFEVNKAYKPNWLRQEIGSGLNDVGGWMGAHPYATTLGVGVGGAPYALSGANAVQALTAGSKNYDIGTFSKILETKLPELEGYLKGKGVSLGRNELLTLQRALHGKVETPGSGPFANVISGLAADRNRGLDLGYTGNDPWKLLGLTRDEWTAVKPTTEPDATGVYAYHPAFRNYAEQLTKPHGENIADTRALQSALSAWQASNPTSRPEEVGLIDQLHKAMASKSIKPVDLGRLRGEAAGLAEGGSYRSPFFLNAAERAARGTSVPLNLRSLVPFLEQDIVRARPPAGARSWWHGGWPLALGVASALVTADNKPTVDPAVMTDWKNSDPETYAELFRRGQ
jgi:hypothetical protein